MTVAKHRVWIKVPAQARRVLVTLDAGSQFDLLESTLARLLRSSPRSVEELAQKLGLPDGLIVSGLSRLVDARMVLPPDETSGLYRTDSCSADGELARVLHAGWAILVPHLQSYLPRLWMLDDVDQLPHTLTEGHPPPERVVNPEEATARGTLERRIEADLLAMMPLDPDLLCRPTERMLERRAWESGQKPSPAAGGGAVPSWEPDGDDPVTSPAGPEPVTAPTVDDKPPEGAARVHAVSPVQFDEDEEAAVLSVIPDDGRSRNRVATFCWAAVDFVPRIGGPPIIAVHEADLLPAGEGSARVGVALPEAPISKRLEVWLRENREDLWSEVERRAGEVQVDLSVVLKIAQIPDEPTLAARALEHHRQQRTRFAVPEQPSMLASGAVPEHALVAQRWFIIARNSPQFAGTARYYYARAYELMLLQLWESVAPQLRAWANLIVAAGDARKNALRGAYAPAEVKRKLVKFRLWEDLADSREHLRAACSDFIKTARDVLRGPKGPGDYLVLWLLPLIVSDDEDAAETHARTVRDAVIREPSLFSLLNSLNLLRRAAAHAGREDELPVEHGLIDRADENLMRVWAALAHATRAVPPVRAEDSDERLEDA